MNSRAGLLVCAFAGCFNPTGSVMLSSSSGSDAATSDTTASQLDSTAAMASSVTGDPSAGSSSTTDDPSTTTSGGSCGDGVLGDGEECDDGNQDAADGCSISCTKEFRRVFVTSKVWSGALGGLDGADEKCQDAANTGELPGLYKAWLSTTTISPTDTFVHSSVPYRQINGDEVATDWSDLISGTLNGGIFVSELGGLPGAGTHNCIPEEGRPVWTNTDNNGKNYPKDCNGWTGVGFAAAGLAGAVTGNWSTNCELDCQIHTAALYCFEQ